MVDSKLGNAERILYITETYKFRTYCLSTDVPPKYEVMFLYCKLGIEGQIIGSGSSIHEIIKNASACIAVVASKNQPDFYLKAMESRNDWHANIVLVIDRKVNNFGVFFHKLSRIFSSKVKSG